MSIQEQINRYLNYLKQDENNVSLILAISDCYVKAGDFDKALTQINQITETSEETALLKARILLHLQQSEEARQLLEALVQNNNSNAAGHGLLSLLYFDRDELELAESHCQQSLVSDPSQQEAQLVRALLDSLQGKNNTTELTALLTAYPGECRLWFALGTNQLRAYDTKAAVESFNKTLTLEPDFYAAWISVAWCYLLNNLFEKAENAYQQAITLDAEQADGYAGLALTQALQNNRIASKELLQKALALDKNNSLASMTEIILANHDNPQEASELFRSKFPELVK